MLTLLRLLSLLPMWSLQLLGWALGWLVFALSPTWRRRFIANAAQAGYRFAQVRAAVGHAGRMVAELPKLWCGPPVAVQLGQRERDLLDRLWASGRGVLFMTPHMGCFELSSQAVAQYLRMGDAAKNAGANGNADTKAKAPTQADAGRRGPMVVLYRPARQAALARLLQTVRNRHGQTAVPTDMGGVRAMLKALRKGAAVGLLPDQVPPWGMGQWVPFLGKPAYTMTIAARLIVQTRPHVVIARCERLGIFQGGYRLVLQELALDASSGQTALVAQINAAVEQQIHACPQQYMWGYARYKVPRGMPESQPHPQRLQDLQELQDPENPQDPAPVHP